MEMGPGAVPVATPWRDPGQYPIPAVEASELVSSRVAFDP